MVWRTLLVAPTCCSLRTRISAARRPSVTPRSEEHTSELQSQFHLVCRLLLEQKKALARARQDPPLLAVLADRLEGRAVANDAGERARAFAQLAGVRGSEIGPGLDAAGGRGHS